LGWKNPVNNSIEKYGSKGTDFKVILGSKMNFKDFLFVGKKVQKKIKIFGKDFNVKILRNKFLKKHKN
jgi:hypothetical protein